MAEGDCNRDDTLVKDKRAVRDCVYVDKIEFVDIFEGSDVYEDVPEFEKVTDASGLYEENAETETISVFELTSVICALNELNPL